MKSITRKISLLLMLSAVLFLSSCLDSGNQSIIRNNELSYITVGKSGIVYAKTSMGLIITSPKIKTLIPGTIALLSFQINEASGSEIVDRIEERDIIASVADISSEPKTLDQTTLQLSVAPEAPAIKFENLKSPIYAKDDYFGDRWTFEYTYKIKKGESVKVAFYKASEDDAKTADCDVLIDVRLEKMGAAEEGAIEETKGDIIVADMSKLRKEMANNADDQGNLNIKFRYYSLDSEDLIKLPQAYSMVIVIK